MEVLEHSVSQYNTVDPWGGFLQYSGVYVCIGGFKVAIGGPGAQRLPVQHCGPLGRLPTVLRCVCLYRRF